VPLSELHAGMRCTGLSVVRGVDISSFDVEVLDVIASDPSEPGARILVRVSGPAIDATGVGPGFSGSPILCDGRNAGAISEGIGEYGNKVALATPIEEILRTRPVAAASARRAPKLLRRAQPLEGPLTVAGLTTNARRLLARAAARADRVVLSAPPGPLGGYPVQDLRPGASAGASISSGDISVGAVGAVTYRDGNQVYAFGHALDGAGRRSAFLQDAYVYAVIGNPLGIPDLGAMTYKLTSAGGHDVGSVTNDTLSAISGEVGAEPPSYPLRATARSRGGGEVVVLDSRLADERALGLGSGLGLVSPLAASTALGRLLDTVEPVTFRACAGFRLRERRPPIGFCNTYFDSFDALADLAVAGSLVDGFDLAPLHMRGAAVSIEAARGVVDDVLVSARAPGPVRAGQRVPVRVTLRRRGGDAHRMTLRVPVPRDLRGGRHTLVLTGSGSENTQDELLSELADLLAGGDTTSSGSDEAEPRSVRGLAKAVAALHRSVGIAARFRHRDPRVVLPSSEVRYSGRATVSVRVLPARR